MIVTRAIKIIVLITKVKLNCCYIKILEKVFYLTPISISSSKWVSKQIMP